MPKTVVSEKKSCQPNQNEVVAACCASFRPVIGPESTRPVSRCQLLSVSRSSMALGTLGCGLKVSAAGSMRGSLGGAP